MQLRPTLNPVERTTFAIDVPSGDQVTVKNTKKRLYSLIAAVIFCLSVALIVILIYITVPGKETISNKNESSNSSYNYGCPYGQNGKYCDPCGVTFQPINIKIVGGVQANPHSYPAHALILFNYQNAIYFSPANKTIFFDSTLMCGGTLINRNTVMTAAHCAPSTIEYDYQGVTYEINVETNPIKPTLASMFTVYLGINSLSEIRTGMTVANAYKHPEFDEKTLLNDIAILKLSNEVTLNSNIQLACLPDINKPGYPTQAPSPVYAVGWGRLEYNGNTPDKLYNVKLTYYDGSFCDRWLSKIKRNYTIQMCAGDVLSGKDTCQGDSGGSIYMSDTIDGQPKMIAVGIVSYGFGCGLNYPGIYSRISAYLRWIDSFG